MIYDLRLMKVAFLQHFDMDILKLEEFIQSTINNQQSF